MTSRPEGQEGHNFFSYVPKLELAFFFRLKDTVLLKDRF